VRVRIAIGSRADPPLPLARLRAREQLVELRAAQLRFTPAEAQEFFQRAGQPPLAADEVCAIGTYAEGWPAGLQLIALALQTDALEQAAESAAQGQPALGHALAAGELARAAELIERFADTAIARGEHAALQRWLERIPESIWAARPVLCRLSAWSALLAGQVERVEPPLVYAERASGDQHKLGEVAQIRAQLAWLRHDAEATIAAARQALPGLAEEAQSSRAASLLALGAGQLLAGELAAADTTLRAAYPQCQAHGRLALPGVLYSQGQLAQQRGQLSEASQKYVDAIQAMGDRAGWERWAAAIGLGDLARERNDLDQALKILQTALAAAEQAGAAIYLPHGYIAIGRAQCARQDFAAADATLERAAHVARQLGAPAQISRARAYRARLALARGDLAAAEQWQAEAESMLVAPACYRHEIEALTLARVLIAQGRAASTSQALGTAQSLLEQLRHAAEAQGRVGSQIEILALAALAAAASGRRDHGLHQLRQALVLAAPAGYARFFLDEGPPIAALLRAELPLLSSDSALRTYIQRLLANFSRQAEPAVPSAATHSILGAQHAAIVEPLSERELEVLRLIAGGASNQAIATRLMISLGTVKSHINHILGKLAAGNRTEAVARAREAGLFTKP
jgi:LuxR family maltose regulon positive regulatory protein